MADLFSSSPQGEPDVCLYSSFERTLSLLQHSPRHVLCSETASLFYYLLESTLLTQQPFFEPHITRDQLQLSSKCPQVSS